MAAGTTRRQTSADNGGSAANGESHEIRWNSRAKADVIVAVVHLCLDVRAAHFPPLEGVANPVGYAIAKLSDKLPYGGVIGPIDGKGPQLHRDANVLDGAISAVAQDLIDVGHRLAAHSSKTTMKDVDVGLDVETLVEGVSRDIDRREDLMTHVTRWELVLKNGVDSWTKIAIEVLVMLEPHRDVLTLSRLDVTRVPELTVHVAVSVIVLAVSIGVVGNIVAMEVANETVASISNENGVVTHAMEAVSLTDLVTTLLVKGDAHAKMESPRQSVWALCE